MALRIVIDEREKKSQIPEFLRKENIHINFAHLPVADYIISNDVAVERKTISDLINSIFDGRIFIQCSELIEHYQKPLILLEGNLHDLINSNDIPEKYKIMDRIPLLFEALSRIVIDYGIPIINVPSPEYSTKMLVTLAKKTKNNDNNGPLLKRIRKGNNLYKQQLSVLSSLPGVGNKLALKMLTKFGNPINVINASVAELSLIPGFGQARAKKVRQILDTVYTNNQSHHYQKTLDVEKNII